jgi:hypothetical protein
MMCTIQVTAQYYENYSDTTTPYWKPKGGVDFHFPIDADVVLYAPKDVLVEVLTKMVEEQSNSYSLYEYIEHEVKFSSPIVVEGLGRELERMLIS